MLPYWKTLKHQVARHRYGSVLFAFLIAAAITGVACVLFMWAFDFVVHHRLDFHGIGAWCWLTTPLIFLLSVQLIRRVAPAADGAGIPQTIFAAGNVTATTEGSLAPLTSGRTMAVKIVAGGAAGLAAAFNTPLAGVTFAIEELSRDYFTSIKDFVLLAIIGCCFPSCFPHCLPS